MTLDAASQTKAAVQEGEEDWQDANGHSHPPCITACPCHKAIFCTKDALRPVPCCMGAPGLTDVCLQDMARRFQISDST